MLAFILASDGMATSDIASLNTTGSNKLTVCRHAMH